MSFYFLSNFVNSSNEIKWNQIRIWRDNELRSTDWTQLPDATVDKQAWANYRQALRDLPAQNVSPDNVIFPARP